MGFAVQPGIGDFEGDEGAAWTEDTENPGEGLILQSGGFQVMQNQDGDRGREGGVCKRQPRGVALDDRWIGCVVARFQFECGVVGVFE